MAGSKRVTVSVPDVTSGSALDALTDPVAGPRMVEVDRLVAHPSNPRGVMNEAELGELAASISAQGVRQNLLVVPDPDDGARFRIVIGHRRAAAARLAGLARVPAVIDEDLSEAQQLELMLVENMQRSDLTVVEEAAGFQSLLDLGMTRAEIAKATGVSKWTVGTRLKVAAAPPVVKDQLEQGQATLENVLALAEFEEGSPEWEDLLPRLGAKDFAWWVNRKRQLAQDRAEFAEAIAGLEARGFTVHPDGSDPDMEGWRRLRSGRWRDMLGFVDLQDPETTQLEVIYGDWLEVRTSVPLEVEDDAEPEPLSEAQIERQRVWDEHHEALKAAVAARREFISEFTSGRRKLTAQQTERVARFLAETLAAGSVEVDDRYTGEWLGLDTEDAPWERRVLGPDVGTGRALLAVMAGQVEGPCGPVTGYLHGYPVRHILANTPELWVESFDDTGWSISGWYGLLGDLGYTPSQWERDRVAGVPFFTDDDADAEDAEGRPAP